MSQKPVIYLKDYQAPAYQILTTDLRFELNTEETLVTSHLRIVRAEGADTQAPLQLHGHESVELISLTLDGQPLAAQQWQREGELLSLQALPAEFELICVTRIHPAQNTALEGLYLSDGIYATQCEAEGFRRITFFPDRPDVMSVFTTTLIADQSQYPILLSNGNPIAQGELEGGRHWVTWQDPHPKPAYLFALVAGNLSKFEDHFTTVSGRKVLLQIYAEAKDLDKLAYAMDSLKRAMQWDEEVYGREYDLDIYMIVAVDFFNMGAMENKGLNIFNTACVLAHPRTTTDAAFQRVESVVAHEYFHNWSGNRVTCRDWFQLSLKEGFTVFRDQCFSADMHSETLKRVEEVSMLRTAQFAEDAGPMAHPVRPESFIEISNFYTLTVYEKGAEVVRMLHTLLGPELFRQGTDLYFARHDGQAVTTDDFVQAMADVSGRDLSQFKRWYSQAGTPRLQVRDEYDAAQQIYRLRLKQSCPATPEAAEKLPFHMPVKISLLDDEGALIPGTQQVLELTAAEQVFEFTQIQAQPLPSLLQGFSAPVKLDYPYTDAQLAFLSKHDNDGFNRWEAGQQLAVRLLQRLIADYQAGKPFSLEARLVEVWSSILEDEQIDPAMKSLLLTLPSEAYLSELAEVIDPDAIHQARRFLRQALAQALEAQWLNLWTAMDSEAAYQPTREEIARRSLKNTCLGYLMTLDNAAYLALAESQFNAADNMTEQQAALMAVAHSNFSDSAAALLDEFFHQWQHESLVMNQWLGIQASDPKPGALARVELLRQHPIYDARNPNKLRAVIGTFCQQNPVNFHALDGQGYAFLADRILELDRQNPQIASRLLTPLTRWRKYDAQRQQLMQAQLQRILQEPNLSGDVYEVASKSV
ncbi:aminopeptidase N [Nitrincola tapanii]|uniref:Aminopeptidase N n=1 Tax=Nitrincola tapanii TaxID=1708751 RepID=A0A5A9W4M6_9GAMM|nr:aminopeptidase N [Nitrincola tapanii]KAA0875726.1 aminopeptidase N [Nitrincola tapanii]